MNPSETAQTETADRVAIRNLIDGYSHNADRRDAEAQAAMFTEDAVVEVYAGEPGKAAPMQVLRGRAAMASAFRESLSKFDTTFHFNGQSTITLNGDRATGETYCLAHHVWVDGGQRKLMVMAIRYYDTFVRSEDRWLISERKLIIDWTDTRPSQP